MPGDSRHRAATVQLTQREKDMRRATNESAIDVFICQHGSIALMRLETENARNWVRDNVSDEAQYFGAALVVEPRYVQAIAEGMVSAGLEVA